MRYDHDWDRYQILCRDPRDIWSISGSVIHRSRHCRNPERPQTMSPFSRVRGVLTVTGVAMALSLPAVAAHADAAESVTPSTVPVQRRDSVPAADSVRNDRSEDIVICHAARHAPKGHAARSAAMSPPA